MTESHAGSAPNEVHLIKKISSRTKNQSVFETCASPDVYSTPNCVSSEPYSRPERHVVPPPVRPPPTKVVAWASSQLEVSFRGLRIINDSVFVDELYFHSVNLFDLEFDRC